MYSIEDINRMVIEYREGEDVLEDLVEGMRPYLMKWVNVLTRRHINTLDAEIQSFVSLFGYGGLAEVRGRLRRVFYHMTSTDIYDELVVKFIERILMYEDIGLGFLAYLKGTFKYVVKRWVDSEAKGLLLHYQDMDNIADSGEESNEVPDTVVLTDDGTLSVLTQKERRILYLRYMDGRSNGDIGRTYNISAASVSQIIAKAKGKLTPL